MVIKGYFVDSGYMGYIPSESVLSGHYMLFASESDYIEYVKELNKTE